MKHFYHRHLGFSLVEMAVVLLILGLLLGSGLILLDAQVEQKKIKDTEALLAQAKDALIGFAVVNGRLPCPASSTSSGQEDFAAGGSAANGQCSHFYDGFLPAVSLGLAPLDSEGYATDAWSLKSNRLRYAVTSANSAAFTTTNGMKTQTIAGLTPNLYICARASGISATTCGSATSLSTSAIAVLYSLGKNAPSGGSAADEAANLNNDQVFVSHTPTPASGPSGEFDDLVTWLSPNILFNRLVQAGKLP